MVAGEEQLTLGQMPAPLFACTPSRLATFDCPRRYRFTYVDRPMPARGHPWAHHVLGATAHVALYRWWLQPAARRTPEQGARLVRRHWRNLGFRDDQQSDRACAATAEWVHRYLAERVDPRAEPVGVERTVATRTARLAISGRIDRLDDRDGKLVVVDYKTGRHTPTAADARSSQALALYVLGVRRALRRDCTRVELHHLPTGTVAAAEHDEVSLGDQVRRAERSADDIDAAVAAVAADPGSADTAFPARTGPHCTWCDFRRHCPPGRAAAPPSESWAGLRESGR